MVECPAAPPCEIFPTPCHNFFVEKGGHLPCTLAARGLCRPLQSIKEKSFKEEMLHHSCPMSLTISEEELINDEERELHEIYLSTLDVTRTQIA